jgi:5-methylcytosine-specific restriction endonuclease McrA
MLREAMFLNGVLHSCEAWHGIGTTQIAQLERVDHHLIRTILEAHSKTPIEFLYLETGALPVKYVITSRRLNYLKHIHMLKDHELVKRVYQAQRNDPRKGDWWEMAQNDLETFHIDENKLSILSKNQAKQYIKEQIYTKAFADLKILQSNHSKVKDIRYEKLTCQEYLKSPKYTFNEASTLFALRSQTVKNIKANIRSFSQNDQLCPLCFKLEDNQEHCLKCPKLKSIKPTENHIEYNHIFSRSESEQHAIANLFVSILERRNLLLQEGLPGT